MSHLTSTAPCRSFLLLAAVALLVSPGRVPADDLVCVKSATFLAPIDSPEHRQYAPSRAVDIRHLALDVTPDFQKRTVAVTTRITFQSLAVPATELRLDATKLTVDEVSATESIQAWQNTDTHIVITFSKPIPTDRDVTVTLRTRAEPKHGLYFRTPEMGYKDGDTHLFTQGEAIEARHWYPCFDAPNEKFTSEITCRVIEGMTVLANGRKVSAEKDPATGLVAVRWLQEQPHANYLISLLAGYFRSLEDKHGDLPIAFHTQPSTFAAAEGSFRDTRAALAFFEKETGVNYPWAKYDQVCVNDFVAGGMENTSITTLTDGTLFMPEFENLRSSQGLMAHELAHQWFGDLVTCKDWSHLWLNEGFATYYAHLFDGHMNGRDALLYGLFEDARGFINNPNDTQAIVIRTYDNPMSQFDFRAYPKGSWVLHMLRSQLGEDLYRRCIRTYLERHRFGLTVTEDLNRIVEELSGQSWDAFFDQWVYHAHHPELEITYAWDEPAKVATVSIRQVQKLDTNVLLFRFPLTVRFKSKSGVDDRKILVRQKAEDFRFPLTAAPEIVRVDPDLTLLARISFTPPTPMLRAQLNDRTDMIGRLLAVNLLAKDKTGDTINRLRATLNEDPFYGVRIEASRALRAMQTDPALDALLASLKQTDARVRRQVVGDVAAYHRERVCTALLQVLEHEKNPDIRAAALRGLGAYSHEKIPALLRAALNENTFRNVVGDAAVAALRAQDDPAFLKPLQDRLAQDESQFPAWSYAEALGVLARLARFETNKEPVREFLLARLEHKRESVRLAAIRALGTLGDPKAAAALTTLRDADREAPQFGAAEGALNELNAGPKPPEALRGVRNDIQEMQRVQGSLRQELDALKKRLEAATASPPPPPPTATPAPPKKSTRPAPSKPRHN